MSNEIKKIVKDVIKILLDNGEISWARYFERCLRQLDNEYHEGVYNIRSSYGGMGSFNDLVLHNQGRPLKKENEMLNDLREKLYKITS